MVSTSDVTAKEITKAKIRMCIQADLSHHLLPAASKASPIFADGFLRQQFLHGRPLAELHRATDPSHHFRLRIDA